MKGKVAVLMSGGVDSSTAAYLLCKQGYEVVGVTLKLWQCDSLTEVQRQLCCSPKDVYDAKSICAQLGIPHYVLDFSKEFEKYIVEQFCKKYVLGLTPNPCIYCNSIIKFNLVYLKLKELVGINFISSGHYAKIVYSNGKYFVAKGIDENKEQSYFLCSVPREVLKYMILPLGELTKNEVRKIAKDAGLTVVAKKKESYDLCFVLEGDYRKFLQSKGYEVFKKGKVVDLNTGSFLGYHKGYINYTIGQRCGIGTKNSMSKRYVVKIDPQNNIVYTAEEKDLYRNCCIITNCVFYDEIQNLKSKRLYVKIRYKTSPVQCEISELEKEKIKIDFFIPQRAVTPGQYAVVYDNEDKIVLSGEIV